MTDETEIKTKDLLFYPSSLLTQDEEGGGDLVKTPLTDATSEVFDPTSSVQKVNGGFTARLVYPAVLTEGREKLLGSFCAISRVPDQENEDVLLFAGDYYGEKWKNAKNRIEAYSVPTIFSKYTLLGYATKVSKQIQCYCLPEEAEPVVGECYCFVLRNNRQTLEYFRVAAVSSEIRTFENGEDTFKKKVINITTTDILNNEWDGLDYPVRGKAQPTTMIYETHISNASHYYGTAKITNDISKNDTKIKVDRIYGQLVPCTTTNTAHADNYPAANNFYIPLGRRLTNMQNNGDLYAPHGILPASYWQQGFYDNGNGQWIYIPNGFALDIDYADGIIYKANNYKVEWSEAVLASNAAYSTFINIDQTNQQTEWAIFLNPYPARGSVHISWLSGGIWFDLSETGDRKLIDTYGNEKGQVSRDGSVVFSCSDLPDAYSQIVIFWTPEEFFKNFADGDLEATVSAESLNRSYILLSKDNEERAIVPNSITVIDGNKQATDDGKGNLVGDFTGIVEYGSGCIQAQNLTNANVRITCKRYKNPLQIKTISPILQGENFMFDCGNKIAKGSFSALLVVSGIKDVSQSINWSNTTSIPQYQNVQQMGRWQRVGSGFHRQMETVRKFTGYETQTNTGTNNYSWSANELQIMKLSDDGFGGLLLDGQKISGTIDYLTGVVVSNLKTTGLKVNLDHQLAAVGDAPLHTRHGRVLGTVNVSYSYDIGIAVASFVEGEATENDDFTISTGLNTFDLLGGKPKPCAPIFNSWTFEINGKIYYENRGTIYQTYNVKTGLSDAVGEIDGAGFLTLNLDQPINQIKILSGVYVIGGLSSNFTCGRTVKAPVVPQSFNVRVIVDGKLQTATADANGIISGDDLEGTIDYRTGFFMLSSGDKIMRPETLKYNCSSYVYIPVNKNIIGLDTVRLRPDGKTPILRAGDTVLIYDRKIKDLGSAFTVGTVCDLGRTGLDRVAVRDAKGMRIPADYYDEDLNAGKITFNSSLNLTGFVMPLHAITSKEELNRIVKCDYSGAIELQNPVSRAFPANGDLYIASCLVVGDLESKITKTFSQVSWTNVWSNERIGNELLAKLNTVDYPITITNEGAITQRWLLQFTSKTQFNIIGEQIGLAGQSDILQDCAPLNPATQKPYFTIPKEAFTAANGSSIWASGNCIRINTTATNTPLWIIKTVQPIEHDQSNNLERTQFEVLFAGDSIIIPE